jgi:hypothetical protein
MREIKTLLQFDIIRQALLDLIANEAQVAANQGT